MNEFELRARQQLPDAENYRGHLPLVVRVAEGVGLGMREVLFDLVDMERDGTRWREWRRA